MKKDITRIYDKRKVYSRGKYLLIIIAILALQVAIYFGMFSKAEKVIPVQYINYYSLETFSSSIDVESDLNGEYVVLPEIINNREVILYYIEGNEEGAVKYNPNDTYYIADAENLTIQVEYGEYITTEENNEDNTTAEEKNEDNTTTEENNEDIKATESESMTSGDMSELPEVSTDISGEMSTLDSTEEVIIDTVYLGTKDGEIVEGEEGTIDAPYRTINQAYEKLSLQKSDGTSVIGKIIIIGTAEISSWDIFEKDFNKSVIITGYNDESKIIMSGDWILQGDTTITDVKIVLPKDNLAIYANGYNLVLGTKGDNVSLKISEIGKQYYPDIYGGSKDNGLEGDTNVTINSGIYRYIYGGSNKQQITGTTNLTINYAIAKQSIYGGSNQSNIDGSTNLNIAGKAIVNGSIYGGSESGAISQNTNLTITEAEVTGSVYGGSASGDISKNTSLTIKYAKVNGSIYGGSEGGTISQNTTLDITYAEVNGSIYGGSKSVNDSNPGNIVGSTSLTIADAKVNGSVYGGSEGGTINGNTVSNIKAGKYGIIATSNAENEVAISGGSKNGSIGGSVNLTIENATIINGYVSGAGNSTGVTGAVNSEGKTEIINLTIKKIKLGDNGNQNNSIYGYGFNGGAKATGDVNITINEIKGNPKYIMGYAYSGDWTPKGNITMTLENIEGAQTEIYGGVYEINTTGKTIETVSKITTTNVKASLLSPGGITENSIKNYNITVDGGKFEEGIYVGGIIKNLGKANVVTNSVSSNTLNLNNYIGEIHVRNRSTTLNLNNSDITTGESFYYSNINMINSKLKIASLLSKTWSLGHVSIDENSELTINSTKNIVFYGNLSGKGRLRLVDKATVLFNTHGINGPLEIDIIEDNDTTSSYVNIISAQKETQEELYLNEELTRYTTEFAEALSYWKFYIGDNEIKSAEDCVYLHGEYGVDENNESGTIISPVKTIAKASEIIKNNPTKKKVVILSHLNLNQETAKSYDTTDVYTIVTSKDSNNIDFRRYVNLNTENSNIYQNIEFQDLRIIASGIAKNIYLNGNNIRIASSVGTSGTINLYGGSNTGDLTGINGNIEINAGTWQNIYGGSNTGNITGNTNNIEINIKAGTISNIYGGSNIGNIKGETNVTIAGGKVTTTLYGGSKNGTIEGKTAVEITGGTIKGNTDKENKEIPANIYGGNEGGTIIGNTNVTISGGTISANIYGGSNSGNILSNKAENIEGGTNLQITGRTIGTYNIYGGSNTGDIVGNVNVILTNNTFGETSIYRGSNSGSITGNITSEIKNITFTSTSANLYGGSNTGEIVGDLEFSLDSGTFKNNTCNANITGGSRTGIIDGNSKFIADGITFNSNLYAIGKLGLSSSITQANNNNVEIKNSTIKGKLYAVNTTGSNILGQPNITINNVKLNTLYAFKTFSSMNTNLNINLLNSESINSEILVQAVENTPSTDLTSILVLNLKDNKSEIVFDKGINLNNLKIENSRVVSKGVLNSKDLTLNANGTLDLKKNSSITNTFAGATDGNNGKIGVYDGLSIGGATGKTTLKIGTITETKTSEEDLSPEDSFVNELGENIFKDKYEDSTYIRTWKVGNINTLETVYVDGTNGNDVNSGEDANNAVETLERAYMYCKKNGETTPTIVICGPTKLTAWPDNASKVVTITSKDNVTDYRDTKSAKLILDVNESSINLEVDTVLEFLDIQVSKTQNIYASGNNLTLGDSINVIDANGKQTNAYLNIYGGSSKNSVQEANLIINSGSYNCINGAGIGNSGATNITINGGNIKTIKTKASSQYTSNELNLMISNATVTNIYYEADKNTEITLNGGSKVTNINPETYSKDVDATCNININTTNPINIDGKSKGNCNVKFQAMKIENYSSTIKNVAAINISNSDIKYTNVISGIKELVVQNSNISINGTTFGTSNLVINANSELVIENTVKTPLTLGTVNFDNTSTIKVLSPLTILKVKGDLNGSGNIYLNDGIRLEIAGKVTGTTTVYCNATEYFVQGTMISASISENTPENAFIVPESNESWKYKDNENVRIWMSKEFTINNIIYINSKTGTSYGLGTKDTPVDTLETAYKIANKRYNENNEETKYYIILQEDLTLTQAVVNTKINENVEVIITNKVASDDVEYNTSLKVNTGKFNFVGKTTIENITIDTTGYANSVEFFADGNEVTFGSGIIVNSQPQKYPIIYGGSESSDISQNEINLTVLSGTYNMIFGGGKNGNVEADINLTIGEETADNLDLTGHNNDGDNYTGVFGAGRYGNVKGNINLNVNRGNFYRIYGAGLKGTLTGDVKIKFRGGQTRRLYGGGQSGSVYGNATIDIGNSSNTATVYDFLRGSGQYSGIEKNPNRTDETGTTELNIYDGALLEKTETQLSEVAAGGYQGNVSTSKLNIYGGTIKCDVYGGGRGNIVDSSKGRAENTEVHIHPNATIEGDVYGGGYAGPADNTNVIVEGTINNVYGGGNEAVIEGNTNVKITNATIKNSAYGGGNGRTATVKGNSTIIVEGTSIIEENLFGGGNASMTGLEDNNSVTNVYIVGGTINGDVYGGANTSIVYGNTNVKIGKEALRETLNIEELNIQPIEIAGTVFGGGRTNKDGKEDYVFDAESVFGNVNIDINAKDIELNIGKSIFASGNATTIDGKGYIKISNYGTEEEPKKLVSIQRATNNDTKDPLDKSPGVTLDNSALWILGTNDTTDNMSSTEYSINRVGKLTLKNNSTLYLEKGVNLVETLESLDSEGNLEYVNINEENGNIEQNVNNKIYLLHGKNIVLFTEDGRNGSVYGMMFLGKFDSNQTDAVIEKGIYSSKYSQGDNVNEEDKNKLAKNSYLQAARSHDIEEDGFYTNSVTEDSKIDIQYIIPREEGVVYQWLIGEESETIYKEIELIASKYSSTAQVTLDLVELSAPDMILKVKSIDTSLLNNNVVLKDESDIPNIAEDDDTANSVFGLTMQTGHQGWKADGRTSYLYKYNEEDLEKNKYGIVDGTTTYYADKSNTTPTLTFNFAHSRNVSNNIDLGKVTINLKATYLEEGSLVSRDVVIELLLRVRNESLDIEYYEGAITPGLRYSVFPTAATNITSKSAISAYYSIYLTNGKPDDDKDNAAEKYYGDYEGYYHAIYSSFVLPEGTKIIIIDQSKDTDKYYYYIVTKDDEQSGKMIYKFTDFIEMGTLGVKYNRDSTYYNKEQNHVIEEFIVQLDFENANIIQDYSGVSLKIQLIDKTDNSVRLTVNDAMYPMMYNIYCNQEPDKSLTIMDKETIHLYEPENLNFTINTNYIYKIVNSNVVHDTTNFDNAEGLKVTFYLDNGTQVTKLTKADLGGIYITYNGSRMPCYVMEDGSIRFKIADAVCNLEEEINVNLKAKESWKPGTYIMSVEAIASADGVNASKTIATDSVVITFLSNEYGLDVELNENSQIINKENGKTLNDNNILNFNIKYQADSENQTDIAKPNIRVALYRRDYKEVYTLDYNLVDLQEFVKDGLKPSSNPGEYIVTTDPKEYIVTADPKETPEFSLNLKDDGTLKTGTYKIKFLVYDGDNYIGEVYEMIIIK